MVLPEALSPRDVLILGAAIVLGALVLLASRGGGGPAEKEQGGRQKERSLPPPLTEEISSAQATATATATGGGGGEAGGKKKKKKKKGKGKAPAVAPAVAPAAAAADRAPEPTPEPEPEPVPEPEPKSNGANGGGVGAGKKKKKKKKGKVGTGGGGGGSAKAEAGKENAAPAASASGAPSASVPTSAPSQAVNGGGASYGQQQQQADDGWVSVVEPKKKKKGGGVAKKPVSAAASSAAAAGGSGEDRASVTVEAKKVGIIIGPKGATMKSIEAATDTKLDISAPQQQQQQQQNVPPGMTQPARAKAGKAPTNATVVITGSPDNIKRAKAAIQELCLKGYTTVTQESGFTEHSVSVHPSVLSELVGPGGSVIRALQDGLDVKVTIPPTDWKPGYTGKVNNVKVGVAGASKDACIRAKGAIQSIVRYHHSDVTHPGLIHEEVEVPAEFLHCVIGSRGSEIRHMKGTFDVSVYIPNDNSYSPNVIVVGRKVMVDRAVSHIMNLMDRDAEMRVRKYDDSYY